METGGIAHGLAGRYATALFELARDRGALADVSASLAGLSQALGGNEALGRRIASPLLSRADAVKLVDALGEGGALDPVTRNFLGVLARNRRLAQLPAIAGAFRRLAAAHRGETTALVTTAHPLSAEHEAALAERLRQSLRREVTLDITVDPSILGGLIVRIGSRVVDASIKTKLAAIGAALKGVS